MPSIRSICAVLVLTMAMPSMAQDEDFELKVASPSSATEKYREAFPTEVEATAWLWQRVKIDALHEQTTALQVEFEKAKSVRFERQVPLANRGQQQPEHYPAMMFTAASW